MSDHAHAAVQAALAAAAPHFIAGAGIDAPLFWQPAGDRHVDQLVRSAIVQLGSNGGTVNAINSMRGACLVQGLMAAMLLRSQILQLLITESHPKALLWLLGLAQPGSPPGMIALGELQNLLRDHAPGASDHERDAALGAFTAFAASTGMQGWRNLYPLESNAMTPLSPVPAYWLPV
jgi:hypothetical protein